MTDTPPNWEPPPSGPPGGQPSPVETAWGWVHRNLGTLAVGAVALLVGLAIGAAIGAAGDSGDRSTDASSSNTEAADQSSDPTPTTRQPTTTTEAPYIPMPSDFQINIVELERTCSAPQDATSHTRSSPHTSEFARGSRHHLHGPLRDPRWRRHQHQQLHHRRNSGFLGFFRRASRRPRTQPSQQRSLRCSATDRLGGAHPLWAWPSLLSPRAR